MKAEPKAVLAGRLGLLLIALLLAIGAWFADGAVSLGLTFAAAAIGSSSWITTVALRIGRLLIPALRELSKDRWSG
jgi:hypothetical protein